LGLHTDNYGGRFSPSPFFGRERSCSAIRVLVIDANECFRSGLAENLRDDGHEVCEYAASSDVPLLTTSADVAVLEYSAPDPDRLAFADTLHRAHAAAAVILITARWWDGDGRDAARPFLYFQSRPLDYQVLHGLIHRLCSHAHHSPHTSKPPSGS
jgi:DNA-binding NarL/FixJ family response regulator